MFVEKTLENGLELVVCPTSAPVAAVQVWVDVGSIDETASQAGYCHFLEHMLFKGTKKRTTSQIAGIVEGSGGDMNAFTSFEYTVYHITMSNKRWKLANEILADMVLGSVFKPGEFHPEKDVILEEIKRGNDSPSRQLYQGAYHSLYGNAGYGRPIIGYPNTVKKCNPKVLKSFWQRWYDPSLMTVVICGDVDPASVYKEVQKTWKTKTRKKPPRIRRRDLGFHSRFYTPKKFSEYKPFPINSVRWIGSYPAVDVRDPILPSLDLSSMILGSGEVSRLHQRLYRDEQIVTQVGAGVWAPMGKGMYAFDAEIPVDKTKTFRKSLWEEVQKFCEEGPTKDELDRAKVSTETDRVYSSQTMDGLANRLGFLKSSLGDTKYDLEFQESIKEVTAEDVRDAARNFLMGSRIREFALLPKDFKSEELWTSDVSAPKKFNISKKAAKDEKITLANGIELFLFPRKEVPVVSLHACALGGLRAETTSSAGIGSIMSEVWDKGPKGWETNKFVAQLERLGANIESFSGRNSLGLAATMLTPQVDQVIPLYIETLNEPRFEADEFVRAQQVTLEDIRTQEDDSGRLVGLKFTQALFGKHPYSIPMIGLKESVESMQSIDLRNHFDRLFRRAPLKISVCGKFGSDQMVRYFENISRETQEDSSLQSLAFEELQESQYIEVQKNREQSHLIEGFLGTRINSSSRFDLKVLLTILGGQSGRLFTELRDKQGLCYTVMPISLEGIEPGFVGVYMGCDPKKRKAALTGIKQELDRIKTKPIPASELKRAKEYVLGRHHMDMQLNANVSSTSALNSLYGLAHDDHANWEKHLKTVTPKSVQNLAKHLFGQHSVTAVVV